MGGPRLTPEQIETAAEVYGKTGSTSAAADAVGVNESTLRAAFKRMRIARNRDLHRAAVDNGLRRGRRQIGELLEKVGNQFLDDLRAGAVEPLHRLQSAGAYATLFRELARLKVLDLKQRQARLTREQTRAQIERLRSADGDGSTLKLPKFLLTERPENEASPAAPAAPAAPVDCDGYDDDEPEPTEAQ